MFNKKKVYFFTKVISKMKYIINKKIFTLDHNKIENK